MNPTLGQTTLSTFRLKQLPSLLLAGMGMLGLGVTLPSSANPTGAQVIAGQASISQQGNLLTIANSPNAIINWQNFSINTGEVTRFLQQNSDSAVLNRIVGQNPSQILGALQSNGRVFLINPNGILFGRDAQVNVNGLIASSLNLSDQDFLNGKRRLTGSADSGPVRNEGSITTPRGGQVYLIAPQVENSGIINAPNGDVLLAAGHSVSLVDASNPDVQVLISAPAAMAVNLGQMIASGGRIGIYGSLVKQSGRVQADSAVLGENGKIIFKSSRDTLLDAGSQTTALGAGQGGEIQILGDRVALLGNASVDASGQQGGGTILVGGDYHGDNPTVQNAQRTILDAGATVRADAGRVGSGGKVIVWSDQATTARGRISARGGSQSGDGGFVEVSGKKTLDFHAKVDVGAPQGHGGTLLLDPASISLVGGTGDGAADGTATFQGGSNPAGTVLFNDPDITTAGISNIYQSELEGLTPGTNIVLEATDTIRVTGTFTGSVLTLPNNSNLMLRTRNASTDGSQAPLGINLTTSDAMFNLEFKTQGTGSITLQTGTGTSPQSADIAVGKLTTGGGAVIASASGNVMVGAAMQSSGGNVTLSGASVLLNDAVNAGLGTIDVTATAPGGNISFAPTASLTVSGTAPATGVRLTADNLSLSGTIVAGSTQEVRINPYTSGRNLEVIASKTGNSLELTPTELNQITTGDLVLNANSGTTTVTDALTTANAHRVALFGNVVSVQNGISLAQADSKILIGAGVLNIGSTGALATTGTLGGITLLSDNMTLGGAAGSINAGAGVVTLVPNTPSTNIELGVGAASTTGILALTPTALGSITSSTALAIGTGNFNWAGYTTVLSGGLTVPGSVGQLTLQSGAGTGNVVINGPLQSAGPIAVFSDGLISVGSGGSIQASNLLLEANKMNLGGAAGSISAGSGTTWLRPRTSGINIDLGSTADSTASTLELSDTEFKSIAYTGTLRIGRNAASTGFGSNDIQISAPIAAAPTSNGVLSLQTDGLIGQTTGATIGATKLALKSLLGINLGESNNVSQVAASVGDAIDNTGKNFKFSSTQALNVANNLDGISGVSTFASGGNYDPLNPDSVVTLLSTGALTQSVGALVSAKALHIEGSRVLLEENNPVGVIAGKATGTAAGDVFHYTSANGVQLSLVDGSYGVSQAGAAASGAVTLKSVGGAIGQDPNAPIVSAGGVHLDTTGPVTLGASGNQVGEVTSQGSSGLLLNNSTALTVGTGGVSTVNGPISLTSGAMLTLANPVNAGTGSVQLTGANVEIAAGGNVMGSMVGISASQASTGLIHSSGAFSVGSTTTQAVKLDADNFDFQSGVPTITTDPSVGTLWFTNASDNRAMTIDAGLSGTYATPFIFYGNDSTAALNTTSSINVAVAINRGSGQLGFATSGALTQSAPVTAQKLLVQAGSATLNSANQVQQVAAQTNGGDFALTNNVPLSVNALSVRQTNVSGISTNNGAVNINNTGAITIDAPINSGTGAINIVAHSPLTVNAAVTSITGNITLEAGASGSVSDVLTVSNTGSVSTSGTLLLKAGDAINLVGSVSGGSIINQSYLNTPVAPTPTPTPPIVVTAPTVDQCIATPTLTGCSTVLPTTTACIATPTLPGCSVVLPNTATCAVTPSLPGCSVVLPSITACIATPTLPGCSVVLPNITACIATPTLPGCSVVLPNITACMANPALPGCSVVLPNITVCTVTPTLPGCSVVLPNITVCTVTPTLSGCSVVLPGLTACLATPTLSGCSAILPTLAQCTSNPTLPGCQTVLPTTQLQSSTTAPVTQALNTTVNLINQANVQAPAVTPVAQPVPPTASAPSNASPPPADSNLAQSKPADSKPDENKKDDKKDEKTAVPAKDNGAKKEEPAKKLYCN